MAARKNRTSRPAHQKAARYAYLVSACLAGIDCTYNGKNKLDETVKRLVDEKRALAVCPEVAGGSPIPRPACEIRRGDGACVLDGSAKAMTPGGIDVSRQLVDGARACLELAKRHGIRKAILKSKSPSCGCGRIYDGTFSGALVKGDGVTAALLRRNGIKIRTEEGIGRA